MEDYINESAETQEVAEPETNVDESAENQEAAEPEQAENPSTETEAPEAKGFGKTETDAAFAEMRRANQQLEREKKQMMQALSRYFEGETPEDLSINALAYADQRDPDEYRQEWEHAQEYEALKATNEDLETELFNLRAEKLMRDDLREIQEIDPSIKSLDDLGESFLKLRLNNDVQLSATEAYYAVKAKEQREKILAPSAIGKVADNKTERDYFTSEEIDNLTDEQLNDDKIWEKVMRSLEKL